jgi:hypothetical protein
MKKTNKKSQPASRKETEKTIGKKEIGKAAGAYNESKTTTTGRTKGHNPPTESTKANKSKAGKPYKQQ